MHWSTKLSCDPIYCSHIFLWKPIISRIETVYRFIISFCITLRNTLIKFVLRYESMKLNLQELPHYKFNYDYSLSWSKCFWLVKYAKSSHLEQTFFQRTHAIFRLPLFYTRWIAYFPVSVYHLWPIFLWNVNAHSFKMFELRFTKTRVNVLWLVKRRSNYQ